MNIDPIVDELVVEGLDDWVPVDTVIGAAREAADADFRELAGAVLERLVVGGLMVAGDIGNDGFERWPEAPPAMVRRVIAQCESFDWAPLGAACWLANTPAGDDRGRQVR